MRFATPLALAALLLAGCAQSASDSGTESITVYAAASLQDAFEAAAAAYEEETGVEIVLSFDASSALRTQISEGAPADLFASADTANPQQLVDAGLTDGDARIFAANGLAIVVPADGTGGVHWWQGMADPGVRVIAAGEDVPITGYATELVEALAALPEAPDGFAAVYRSNIVSREDNVRAVLAKIEAGEGDVAIVYETDAASTDAATTIPFPLRSTSSPNTRSSSLPARQMAPRLSPIGSSGQKGRRSSRSSGSARPRREGFRSGGRRAGVTPLCKVCVLLASFSDKARQLKWASSSQDPSQSVTVAHVRAERSHKGGSDLGPPVVRHNAMLSGPVVVEVCQPTEG